MKVIYGIGRFHNLKGSCVTVGVFDGVHRGHQAIIKKVVAVARRKNLTSIVITFFPHPDSVIHPGKTPPSLISFEHRLQLLRSYGIDVCVVLRFTPALKALSPERFIRDILIKRLHMKEFVVSRTFAFGKNKSGETTLLQRLSKRHHFSIHTQDVLRLDKKIVSSTCIRSLILSGKLIAASRFLGRKVEVLGTVVRGDRRGRQLGFPTANIDPHHEVIPPRGVYVARTQIKGRRYAGLVSIGLRPTFKRKKNKTETVELHILNFHGNLYGRDVKIVFLKKLRDEIKFPSAALLVRQMKKDKAKARRYFSSH